MPKSIATAVAPQTNTQTTKLPLFMGGEHGNALGQIIFTFDEWQSLINALDEYAPNDKKGVYEVIKDRINDQTNIESYALNLYCYQPVNIEILEFIVLAVIQSEHKHLKSKLLECINEQSSFWLSEPDNYESVSIESNDLFYSLQLLKNFSYLAIKGGN